MPAKVYVVMGSTGEYSDHIEWPVCAFAEESLARDMVERLTKALANAMATAMVLRDNDDYYAQQDATEAMRLYDPNIECDYTGTRYGVMAVEMRNEVPEMTIVIGAKA